MDILNEHEKYILERIATLQRILKPSQSMVIEYELRKALNNLFELIDFECKNNESEIEYFKSKYGKP